MSLSNLLDNYSLMLKQRKEIDEAMLAAIDQVLTPPQRAYLDALKVEFDQQIATADNAIKTAEQEIRQTALANKEGDAGAEHEVLYSEGKTTWDTDGLDDAIELIPGLAKYRKQGDPYTTLRKVKVK